MKPQTVLMALVLAAVATIAGCDRPHPDESGPTDEPSAWDASIADRARLIDQLPGNTIAYLRLPSLWGLAGAPKSGALARGLDTPANRDAIAALQARLPALLKAELGELAPLLTLLLETLRSPLEIALVGDGPQPLEADLIIEGRFEFDSVAELDDALASLAERTAALQLLEPAGEDGPGQLLATMFPIFYEFDESTRRARFLTGMSATAGELAASRGWRSPDESPLRAFEHRIDASGHGLYHWADMARLGPMMRRALDTERLARFEAMGVFATRQLALGYGSTGGKARAALLAEGRDGRLWDLSLPASGAIDFRSSGKPDFVFGLALPDSDWLNQALQAFGAEAEGAEVSARLEEEIGLDLATVIDTFAGRMFFVDDANGTYLVHEGGDTERWAAFWDALARRFDIGQSSTRVAGAEIHHLVIPGVDIADELGELRSGNPGLAFVMSRSMQVGTHLFWMAENGRILVAAVPQVLMARLDHPGDTGVGDWLDGAGVDTRRAGLFGAMRIDDAPRRNYYTYISALLGVADMLEAEIDVNAFPTARELDLPEAGTVGFALDYARGRLGATLVFENHPGDLLYAGGGLGTIAAAGILAAIAIPAYQDYTVRARVATAHALAMEKTARIEDRFDEPGGLSGGDMEAFLERHSRDTSGQWYSWETDPPALVIHFFATAGLDDGAELRLSPQLEDGRITGWTCSSLGIERKHLPENCR